jgi:predicted DNA-binding protein (UPF0251 family)
MARPLCCRQVAGWPERNYFKPRGVPLTSLQEVTMSVDEFEAIRLADLEGLYQEQAAERMGISRPTFGRIIESAHQKVADALANGKALKIEGGEVEMAIQRLFRCNECQHTWGVAYGTGRPSQCPQCGSSNIFRAEEDRGRGRAMNRGRGGGMRHGRFWGPRGSKGSQGGEEP